MRGDVDEFKLVLVNTSKLATNSESVESFGAKFSRVHVSNQSEILVQLSNCFAWVILCVITLYISALITSNLDGRLFIETKTKISPPKCSEKPSKNQPKFFITSGGKK